MTYSAPTETNLSKQAVDTLASNIANQIGYLPGADLYHIVERLGGQIQVENISENHMTSSGSIKVEEDGHFIIFLAAHTGPTRDRFTIAHEIGHYILHYIWPNRNDKIVRKLEANRYGSGRVEWEANWFAAGFLMPSAIFMQKFEEFSGSLTLIAKFFGVSNEASRVRASYLSLI